MLTTVDAKLGEILHRIDDDGTVVLPPETTMLEFLQMTARGQIKPTQKQLKAAIAAVQYTSPKLAVIATTNVGDLGERLDRAREAHAKVEAVRAEGRLGEAIRGPQVIEGRADHPADELAKPFASTSAGLRRRV